MYSDVRPNEFALTLSMPSEFLSTCQNDGTCFRRLVLVYDVRNNGNVINCWREKLADYSEYNVLLSR